MHRTKSIRTFAAVAALGLVLTACGGDEPAEPDDPADTGAGGDDPLELGYVLPETGQLAFLGPPQIQATRYAISVINEAGGVNGQEIPDVVTGDEGDQASIVTQSAERVLQADVDAIIGAAASGRSLDIIDMVTGAEVVQCSGSNTAPTFTDYDDGGYYIRTAPSDALQGPILADTISQDGHASIAILARADDYGRGLADATAEAFEEAGGTVVLNETYDPAASNFDAPVQSALSTDADAIVVIAFEEGAQIISGLLEAGIAPAQLYGADGLRSEDLPELVAPDNPAALAGMQGTAPASAENEEFVTALQEFAPDLEELQFAPQVFDCVNVIALAAQAAGSNDPTVFKDSLVDVTLEGTECSSFEECKTLLEEGEDIDYQGASGPLDFIEAGEPGVATIEVYTFDESGALQSVRTVESQPLEE